jgi:phosphohistidine phosphatase
MQRYLYLMRHAQSADKQAGQTDKDRELTPSGIKQSVKIASFFLQQKTFPDVIFSSSAERAKTTATLIADTLKLDQEQVFFLEELYDPSARTLLQTVAQFEDNLHHVLCITHNPAITYLAEYLTKEEIGEMVPAGMAIIELDVTSWTELLQSGGKLIRYIQPENIT